MEMQIERLEDEFLALKTALEEALIKGQRLTGDLGEVSDFSLVSSEYSISARATARPGVVGWVDDL